MFLRRFGTDISNNHKAADKAAQTKAVKLPHASASLNVFQDLRSSGDAVETSQKTSTRVPLAQLDVPSVAELSASVDALVLEDNQDEYVEDIDQYDRDDPQFVTEYVNDIFSYLKFRESELALDDYMETVQTEVRPRHRNLLVAWMTRVYHRLRLLSETMLLAVRIVDTVLATKAVSKKKLELVGLGALLIASKFEETHAPILSDFRICLNYPYRDEEILRVERVLLDMVGFNLCFPSPLIFLRRYSKAAVSDSQTHTLSKYLTEISSLSYDMHAYLDSEVAAAAVYLARHMRHISPPWNACLEHYTEFSEEDILECAASLNTIFLSEASKGTGAIFTKYSDKRLFRVAETPYLPL